MKKETSDNLDAGWFTYNPEALIIGGPVTSCCKQHGAEANFTVSTGSALGAQRDGHILDRPSGPAWAMEEESSTSLLLPLGRG
jgi:hypothetical protein